MAQEAGTERGAGVLAILYLGYPGSTGEPNERELMIDGRAAYACLLAKGHAPIDTVSHRLSLGTGRSTLHSGLRYRGRALSVSWLMRDQFLTRERSVG